MLRAIIAALAIAVPAGAAHSGGVLMISAVVPRIAQLALRDHPATVTVTAADVARGYVDVSRGPRMEVRTNSREGLRVSFHASGPVRAVQMNGAGDALVVLGSPGGMVTRQVPLEYRLVLAPAAEPGVYAWPVQVVATPL